MRQKSVSAVNQACASFRKSDLQREYGSFRSRLLRPDAGSTPQRTARRPIEQVRKQCDDDDGWGDDDGAKTRWTLECDIEKRYRKDAEVVEECGQKGASI
jgi:hypothetical protein